MQQPESPITIVQDALVQHPTDPRYALTVIEEWCERASTSKEKGDRFELFAYHYLSAFGGFQVKRINELTAVERAQFSLPNKDMGIDLVYYEPSAGSWSSVQVKYRNTCHTQIPWKELSTFHAISERTGPWTSRVTITNCAGVKIEGRPLPNEHVVNREHLIKTMTVFHRIARPLPVPAPAGPIDPLEAMLRTVSSQRSELIFGPAKTTLYPIAVASDGQNLAPIQRKPPQIRLPSLGINAPNEQLAEPPVFLQPKRQLFKRTHLKEYSDAEKAQHKNALLRMRKTVNRESDERLEGPSLTVNMSIDLN